MKTSPRETISTQTRQPRLQWLGQLLHRISYIKIAFYLLGIYFQFRAMFFSHETAFLNNINSMLLMYGIAMSFESLRDNDALTDGERRSYLARPGLWAWFLALLFGGGLISMAIGCMQFFLAKELDLGWGITTFGLGIIALGRQQYDQFTTVLSRAQANETRDGG
jgi:hypothetical protein